MHSRNLKVCSRGSQIDSLATLQNRSRHRVWPVRKRTTNRFFQRLFGDFCSHRFTWPRPSVNGKHYQICLTCGNAYEYDWKTMRRTDRLLGTNGQHSLALAQTRLPGINRFPLAGKPTHAMTCGMNPPDFWNCFPTGEENACCLARNDDCRMRALFNVVALGETVQRCPSYIQ
jgi:hypothetical protein